MAYFIIVLLSVMVSLGCGEHQVCNILDLKCKRIDSCPTVLDMLKLKNARKPTEPRNTEHDEYLTSSNCGFEDKMKKVWCPGLCTLPDGNKGECLDLDSCDALKIKAHRYHRMSSSKTHKFLAKYRCAVPRDFYCCPLPSDAVNNYGLNCSASATALPPHPESGCCGVEKLDTFRVIGGEPTNQFAWLALIEYKQKGSSCDGSLISERYVLTAAHCADAAHSGKPWRVRLGEYNLQSRKMKCTQRHGIEICSDGTTDSLRIEVKLSIRHPRYRNNTFMHDIALLRLKKTATLSDHVRPICLPCSDITANPPSGLKLSLVGWDSTRTSKHCLNVPYVDLDTCKTRYKNSLPLKPSHICVGGEGDRSDCAGDSGGPVMHYTGTHYQLVGVISRGPVKCGIASYPTIHTKVFEYLEWITGTILKHDRVFGG